MDDTREVAVQRRRGPAEIEQLVAEFVQSGLRRSEFCRRHGMTLGTLNRYLKRMRGEGENGGTTGGLVAVELAGTRLAVGRESGGGLAVVLGGGRRIEVGAGFDAPTLERLVGLLEKM
ncbi:MAG: hypothetical protein WB347_01970 [Terriglobales bacterium]